MALIYFCTACGSANVLRSACSARWDISKQQFVLDGIGSTTRCVDCESETASAAAQLDGTVEALASNSPHLFKCIDWRKMPRCSS